MHQEPVTKTEEAGRTHFRTGEDTGRMTVPEMTEYLTEMKLQEESLRKRRQEVEGEIVTVDEYIRLNAYGSHSGEGMGRSGFRDSDTLYRIWENIEREYEERLAVLSEEALRIAKEEQKLGYVRSCMRFLPAGQEEILRMLYVEGIYPVTWYQPVYGLAECVTGDEQSGIYLQHLCDAATQQMEKWGVGR